MSISNGIVDFDFERTDDIRYAAYPTFHNSQAGIFLDNDKEVVKVFVCKDRNTPSEFFEVVVGKKYIVDPVHPQKKHRGRKVRVLDFVYDVDETFEYDDDPPIRGLYIKAKIQYLDNMRNGKQEFYDLNVLS